MARWGSYLMLLVLLATSLCESAEYYIRPTLTTNTSCPGQPCLTLNQYMKNTSHYIQSNTVLNFLPGKHVVKIPLLIKNAENITLKSITTGSGMHSQLVVKFSCENESLNHCIYTQSAIEMINVTNVVINDISLEIWTPNVSGVTVEQSTYVHLQLHIHSVQENDSLAAGVAVNETSHLYMDGLRVGNLYNGIRMENTNKVSIINSSFDNCQNSGMVIIKSDVIDISNTTVSNNMENGMYLESCSNTTLTGISSTNNLKDGMDLISCSSVSLKDISVINNSHHGLILSLCINTDVKNINATNNQNIGLVMSQCKHVRMMMMYLEKNQVIGIVLIFSSHMRLTNISSINNSRRIDMYEYYKASTMMNISAICSQHSRNECENTTMMNISAINIQHSGIYMYECENTTMMNISVLNNQQMGMVFESCENTIMKNVSAINNQYDGMYFDSCENTKMVDISAINNHYRGVVLKSCKNTTMMNISAIYNKFFGIYFHLSESTTMVNISAISNQLNGILIYKCENTTVMTISAINNRYNGMYFDSCENTTIMNISAINNQYDGMYFDSCENTAVMNISVLNNQDDGVEFKSCENTAVMNISAINNQYFGIYFHLCENTTMLNISAFNNQQGGMVFGSCENTKMMNIAALNNQEEGIVFVSCKNTTMMNVSAINNEFCGFLIHECKNITMLSISAFNNQEKGMIFESCENTAIMNISVLNNQLSGILMHNCENTTMLNISALNNQQRGIVLESCEITTMKNISTINNQYFGIYVHLCRNTTMVNISAIYNRLSGILIHDCENTMVVNISALNNEISGMVVYECENTTTMNISAINNQISGIVMYACENTNIMNIFAKSNQYIGMYFDLCENTTMMNISAINNQYDGILMYACKNTIMTHVSALSNQNGVILKDKCSNTILAYVNATFNNIGGIVIENHFQTIVLRNISVNHNGNIHITLSSSHNLRLEDSIITDVVALPSLNIATNPHTVPAVIELNDCTLIMSNCHFTRNNITSIRAIGSKIIVEGEIIFSDNRALSGAALLFASSSVLAISERSRVSFQNNHAVNYGGAIYIQTDEFYNSSKSIQDVLYNKSIQDILHSKSFQDVVVNQSINVRYSTRPSLVTPSTRCFLSVAGNRSQARLIFTNNTAGRGGDVVYGGLVPLGYDGDWNCLLSFKNISDMSQQSGLSIISSEPSRVCLCHDGQPDCLTVADPITRSMYPGQTITIPAVVVGQDFGSVTGSVIAQFLQDYTTCPIQLEQGQKSTFVNNGQCADIKYTLYTNGGENCVAILTLKTNNAEVLQPMTIDDNHKIKTSWTILNDKPNYHELASHFINETLKIDEIIRAYDLSHIIASNYSVNNLLKIGLDEKFVFPNEIYSYPTFINISFRSCPIGFALSRNAPFKCDCNHLLRQMPRVTCDIQHQTITRDGLVWIGTYHDNETVAASKYCPYNYCRNARTEISLRTQESNSGYSNHSTTDFQCNHHHSGVLCGRCKPGLSLALGTNQCLRCSNVYITLLLPFATAGLLLVFFIKFFDLTISQGTMNELIFYVNVVSANKHLYYSQTNVNPVTLFIAWLNLDIGIETCFFNGLTAYSRTWLQFVFPLYIWAIAGLIIIIAKYSDRVAKVMGNNGVPVLATLFLLSYAKLFNTIITAMSYTTLYTTQGKKLVWSADGNLDYLGPKHIPLFCVAVAAVVFLWFPYTLLLLLGQWLYKLDCRLITCMLLNLKPFLDAHFAAFKDNHRYWFGFLLLVRAANVLISAIIPDNTTGIFEFSTAILSILLTFWGQRVYRSNAVGTFGTAFLLNLAILNVTRMNSNSNILVASFTLIAIALAQFLGLVLYKVVVIVKCSHRMTACCAHENEPSNDWELYEQAAAEREQAAHERQMKPDTEVDRESEMTGTLESVPTYGI